MADWLEQVTVRINALPVHETVRDLLWVVPTFQTIHILSGIVFSASLLVALRALGIAGTFWSLARWHRRFSLWTGFALLALFAVGERACPRRA